MLKIENILCIAKFPLLKTKNAFSQDYNFT